MASITNKRPTYVCVVCGGLCQPHTLSSEDSRDFWPTYYRNIGDDLVEFCGPGCSLNYIQKVDQV